MATRFGARRIGIHQTLMVRRRVSAVSNHEAETAVASSFEPRLAPLLGV